MPNTSPQQRLEPLTQKNKGMLALVIFLGVLIIVATTVLIFMIVNRIIHKNDVPQQTHIQQTQLITVNRPISVLQEPQGTRIINVSRQSDHTMVITLSGGGVPDRLVIWDIAHQQKISEIKLSDKVGQ